ncbi:DNA-3-methyladenine glycosylase family protein [Actinomycetospora atypica]|uniref:DNA-3-methyladenine glycosylase family protein n=1 Tax=Actinomycetospora atypica TaxID=1290095 RepID=A0ABV9YT12_9PSEU
MTTTSGVRTAAMLTLNVTNGACTDHVLHPDGPFSLAAARGSVRDWPPLSRFAAGPEDDRPDAPLVLATIADDDLAPVAFAVSQEHADGPVEVAIVGTGDPDRALAQIARILSLDHSGAGLTDVAGRDPAVGAVLARHPGRRPVLFGSPYEAAAWGVISTRMRVRQAVTLVRRLAAEHGTRLEVAGRTVDAFPTPEALLALDEIPGLPGEKVRRLHAVARAALDGDLDAARLRALGPVGARAAVCRIRGIGGFWASLIWLRACGVVDEWPDEPRATAALARLHGRDPAGFPDAGTLAEATAPLAPYRTWIAFLLRITGA